MVFMKLLLVLVACVLFAVETRGGALSLRSAVEAAATARAQGSNCNCNTHINGQTYYYEGAYNRCTCDQGCGCTVCWAPSGVNVFYVKNGANFVSGDTGNRNSGRDYGGCRCAHGWINNRVCP
jgi:hypothetical protein